MGNSSDSFPVPGEGPIRCCAFTKSFIHSPEWNLTQTGACLAQFWLAWLGFWTTFLGGLHEHVLMSNDKAQPLALAWHSQAHIPSRMRQLDAQAAMKWCVDVDRQWKEDMLKASRKCGWHLGPLKEQPQPKGWRPQRASKRSESPLRGRGAECQWLASGGLSHVGRKTREWTSVLGLDLGHFHFL